MRSFASAVALVTLAAPALALKVAMPTESAVGRFAQSPVAVVGKVTEIETEAVEEPPYPGAPAKVAYRVAVVRIDTPLRGVGQLTHVRVGFVPSEGVVRRIRPGPVGAVPINLEDGQEGCFFLSKHPTGGFYVINPMRPPVFSDDADYKAKVSVLKRAAAAVADPLKALKADKAEDRAFAAAALVRYYRTSAADGREVDLVPVPQEISGRIVKALAECDDWANGPGDRELAPAGVLGMMNLTERDGWKMPPFDGKGDYAAVCRDYFRKWAADHADTYTMLQLVPKKP